ncbi:hypothetical protein ECMP0215528_5130 [Escherichia coli MP021552.8]|nr:hypothetical protein ECMP0215528_5130 [Escherichia coli MP021552.8]
MHGYVAHLANVSSRGQIAVTVYRFRGQNMLYKYLCHGGTSEYR